MLFTKDDVQISSDLRAWKLNFKSAKPLNDEHGQDLGRGLSRGWSAEERRWLIAAQSPRCTRSSRACAAAAWAQDAITSAARSPD